ncbi:SlyX family protein [Lichenihabitans sp. Uapishka_5]|uniref:SlyX family protein n=1 Tax=Lichenihabitans sp. Uapishka_5 TaxID=3037302 RepID=UPI0029E80350|nr:SlyX family protein [Lichenihabitans sp. Uapishka_5]MDX7953755.1 SlyX family protein [Lichenihabitans sp. Uapishka_5]
MSSMPDISARLEALETHAAHQGEVVEALNATVTAQWAAIDALRRQMGALVERLEATETRDGPPAGQRPPHY